MSDSVSVDAIWPGGSPRLVLRRASARMCVVLAQVDEKVTRAVYAGLRNKSPTYFAAFEARLRAQAQLLAFNYCVASQVCAAQRTLVVTRLTSSIGLVWRA